MCEPVLDLYTAHLVPNIFCALPIVTVAVTRRCVTSTVALTLCFLNALTTPLRFDDEAPYLLCSVDSDGYLPYELDEGLLADLTAFWRPDWFASRPTWSVSFLLVDADPSFLRPLWAIGP